MDVIAHTTPDNRRMLRDYLRNRRLTTSLHNTLMTLVLNDLEEALRLLEGIHHPSAEWSDRVEAFLIQRVPPPPGPDPSWSRPRRLEPESAVEVPRAIRTDARAGL